MNKTRDNIIRCSQVNNFYLSIEIIFYYNYDDLESNVHLNTLLITIWYFH